MIILTSAQQQNKPGRMTELGGRQLALKQFQKKQITKDPSLTSHTGSIIGYTGKGSSKNTAFGPNDRKRKKYESF